MAEPKEIAVAEGAAHNQLAQFIGSLVATVADLQARVVKLERKRK
jgi:hypothetical protein